MSISSSGNKSSDSTQKNYQEKLLNLALQILKRGKSYSELIELDGNHYQKDVIHFDGYLYGSEDRILSGIGRSSYFTVLNTETESITINKTGKYVCESRRVSVMSVVYTQVHSPV